MRVERVQLVLIVYIFFCEIVHLIDWRDLRFCAILVCPGTLVFFAKVNDMTLGHFTHMTFLEGVGHIEYFDHSPGSIDTAVHAPISIERLIHKHLTILIDMHARFLVRHITLQIKHYECPANHNAKGDQNGYYDAQRSAQIQPAAKPLETSVFLFAGGDRDRLCAFIQFSADRLDLQKFLPAVFTALEMFLYEPPAVIAQNVIDILLHQVLYNITCDFHFVNPPSTSFVLCNRSCAPRVHFFQRYLRSHGKTVPQSAAA